MFSGHGSHLSLDAAALKKPGLHSANTKIHLHEKVNKDNNDFRQHPIWHSAQPVPPDHSRLFKTSVTPWTFHLLCKTPRLSGHVIISRLKVTFGQVTEIWERKQKRGSAHCWLYSLKHCPFQQRHCSHEPSPETKTQTPWLAGTPSLYFFNHNPPPLLLSYCLSLSQQTQPVIPHSTTVSQSSMLHYNKRNKGKSGKRQELKGRWLKAEHPFALNTIIFFPFNDPHADFWNCIA